MSDVGIALVGLAIAVGLAGVVVPVVPGALLVWAAIIVWALSVGSTTAFVALAVATALIAGGQVVKLVVPGRRLADAGVPRRSIFAGMAVAVVGFLLIPLVGLLVGFPVGVYLAERHRLGEHASARRSTEQALRAIGLSIVIELSATALAAVAWLLVVVS
jgi:uncharacterized protein YqgC (DUF456 family)